MSNIKDDVIGALKTVYDPEIPVNIWDMGLVYDIKIDGDKCDIIMTLTSPTCPMMDELVANVKSAVGKLESLKTVDVHLVWEPAWDLSRMSDAARVELDLINQGL
jgi:FeS assembly SUF system protein